MEHGRVPFPAAWKSLHDVGASGRQGSNIASCSNAKIHCSIRSGQPVRRTVGDPILFEIRCRHFWRLPEEIAAPPSMQSAHCSYSRQCPLSPRYIAEALPFRKALCSIAFFPSAIQPRTKSGGKSLETGEKAMHSQSILSTAQRLGLGCEASIGVMESTK